MSSEAQGQSNHPEAEDHKTPEQRKRHLDRTGEDWTPEEVSAGIENRIRVEPPGGELKIRGNTDTTPVDATKTVMWGQIINILVDKGVLARTDEEDVYTKQIEGLCADPNGPKSVQDITEIVITERLAALDLTQESDLREFLTVQLRSHIAKMGNKKLREELIDNIPKVVDEMAAMEMPLPTIEQVSTEKSNLAKSIGNAIPPNKTYGIRFMVQCRDIAHKTIDAIYKHPSTTKE